MYSVVFPVTVPALGFTTVFLDPSQFRDSTKESEIFTLKEDFQGTSISNEYLDVEINGKSGLWTSIENKLIGKSISVNQGLYWYNASAGNSESPEASGFLLFYLITMKEHMYLDPTVQLCFLCLNTSL